jgi:hypothetical protein
LKNPIVSGENLSKGHKNLALIIVFLGIYDVFLSGIGKVYPRWLLPVTLY